MFMLKTLMFRWLAKSDGVQLPPSFGGLWKLGGNWKPNPPDPCSRSQDAKYTEPGQGKRVEARELLEHAGCPGNWLFAGKFLFG